MQVLFHKFSGLRYVIHQLLLKMLKGQLLIR